MKPIVFTAAAGLAVTFAIAACVPQVAPPATTAPTPPPVQTAPTPTPQPPPTAVDTTLAIEDDWLDRPATAGMWQSARGAGGPRLAFRTAQSGEPFAMECQGNDVRLTVASPANASMIVATETASRTFALERSAGSSGTGYSSLAARDPFLDAMAFSRGRFAVAVTGQPNLYLPTRPDITRFLEECRTGN